MKRGDRSCHSSCATVYSFNSTSLSCSAQSRDSLVLIIGEELPAEGMFVGVDENDLNRPTRECKSIREDLGSPRRRGTECMQVARSVNKFNLPSSSSPMIVVVAEGIEKTKGR